MEINQKLKVTGELADKVRQVANAEHRTLHNTMLVLIERGLKAKDQEQEFVNRYKHTLAP